MNMTNNGTLTPTEPLSPPAAPAQDGTPSVSEDLAGYSRFVQRIRRRYANELALLAPGMPEPAAMRQTYAALRRRILAFVALPFESLSRLSLQSHVDAIGADLDAKA